MPKKESSIAGRRKQIKGRKAWARRKWNEEKEISQLELKQVE